MMRTLFLNRKIIFVLVCFLLSFSVFSAEKKVPDWYEHKEVVYPGEFYISAIGEGITKEEAEELSKLPDFGKNELLKAAVEYVLQSKE